MSAGLPSSRRSAAGIPVPPECREMIRRGALVAVSTSGGKDSQAMTILLSRIVPRDRFVAVHAPLGEVEWPGTIEHIATGRLGFRTMLAQGPGASGASSPHWRAVRSMARSISKARLAPPGRSALAASNHAETRAWSRRMFPNRGTRRPRI